MSARLHREHIELRTPGRGTTELTRRLAEIVSRSGVGEGMCNAFVQHTSASLIVCENADPAVRRDLELMFGVLAPDGDPRYEHADEGPDDMAAHLRSVLTQCALTIPVAAGRLALGTWQGVYLWEHRHSPHRRRVIVSVWGS